MTNNQGKKNSIKTNTQMTQLLELANKDFKMTISMLKEKRGKDEQNEF